MVETITNQMVGIALVIFMFLILLLGYTRFPDVLNFFGLFGDQSESYNLQVSRQSTGALTCAVSAVAAGQGSCLNDFKTAGPGLGEAELTSSKASVSCTNAGGENVKCTVKNFWLPQKVTDASTWISDYGDPAYVAYWQSFPPEEDTWTYKEDLKIHVIAASVAFIPLGKTASVASKIEQIGFIAPEKFGLQTAIKNLIKNTVGGKFKTRVIRLASGATIEGAARAAAYADSVIGKFEPRANKIILKSPYESAETYNLPPQLQGSPIVLERETGLIGTEKTIAHFASPCKIESMDVEPVNVLCPTYTYNSLSSTPACSPLDAGRNFITIDFSKESQSQLPACDIDSYMGFIGMGSFDFNGVKSMPMDKVVEIFRNNGYTVSDNFFNVGKYLRPADEGAKDSSETDGMPDHLYFDSGITGGLSATSFGANLAGVLMDTDYDGRIDSYSVNMCSTPGIGITNVKKLDAGLETGEHNYCFDERGFLKKSLTQADDLISFGSGLVTAGAIAGVVTGGTAWALTATAGVLSIGASYVGCSGCWPGSPA
ncbi:MAG: hypothetical protein HY367_01085 [Candidatus Aenigmarchaeota archaeon]|nr:hypothetical protein [Candidatus Aenigmarchaeota archaeon]